MKRTLYAVALLAIALVALAKNPAIHEFEAKGSRGRIKFWGNGEVWLEGRGSLAIHHLTYMNIKNEGKWERAKDLADGIQYYNFEGKVYILGRDIDLELRGWDLSLRAKGQGEAHLQGDGTYTLDGQTGEWDRREQENRYKKLHFKK